MNSLTVIVAAIIMMGTMALAQDGPRPRDGDHGAVHVAQGPGGEFGPGGPSGPGMGGPGGPGGPGGRMIRLAPDMQKYEMLRAYIDTVDRFSKLAADPTSAAIAAVVSASDLLRQRGPASAIEYFNKMLPQVKDPTVARAIRLQLIDLYKATNETDKALVELETLMKGTAPTGSVPATP